MAEQPPRQLDEGASRHTNTTQGITEASVRALLAGDDLVLCPQGQGRLGAVVAPQRQSAPA
jgi:hypothetical protein